MLSGGQRQRVALARGLVREPVMVLLDDVLSAVDHHTEQELVAALRERGSQPTTVLVAHRISALQHADVIVVLDDGRVVDVGRHAELVERPGFYRETWLAQTEEGP
jgi:ATP-binding cassette subfamily B protein